MKRFHIYLVGLVLSLVLLSINRLTPLTQGLLEPHGYLRWLDFNAMLPISILFLVFYWLLKEEIVSASTIANSKNSKALFWITFLIIIAIYLNGASSGVHEPMNYLNHRYCLDGRIQTDLCEIINTNDEDLGHILYYISVIILTLGLALIEYFWPRKEASTSRELSFTTAMALLIALGIFANLAHDTAFIPMTSFSLIAISALVLLGLRRWNIRHMPLTYYFALSYSAGVIATITYKLLA